jgi:hypothetical protein
MIGNLFGRLRFGFPNGISFVELCGLYAKWRRRLSRRGEDAVPILKSRARDNLVHRVRRLRIQPSMRHGPGG